MYSFNQTIVSHLFVSFKVILVYTLRFHVMFGHGDLVYSLGKVMERS